MANITPDRRCQPLKERSLQASSYYSREQARLRERQKQINYIKRVGRRKMSKARRAALEELRRQEVMGLRCPYRTNITQASWKGPDPSVPKRMRDVESSRRTALRARRTLLLSQKPCEEADAAYKLELDRQIADAMKHTNEHLEDAITNPFVRRDDRFLHRQRRLVAGYHQELEFLQQKDKAYVAALEDRMLILEGHRPPDRMPTIALPHSPTVLNDMKLRSGCRYAPMAVQKPTPFRTNLRYGGLVSKAIALNKKLGDFNEELADRVERGLGTAGSVGSWSPVSLSPLSTPPSSPQVLPTNPARTDSDRDEPTSDPSDL
ncbi:hypothetical protein EWM64_g8538, partial [Hericium alpestre]